MESGGQGGLLKPHSENMLSQIHSTDEIAMRLFMDQLYAPLVGYVCVCFQKQPIIFFFKKKNKFPVLVQVKISGQAFSFVHVCQATPAISR